MTSIRGIKAESSISSLSTDILPKSFWYLEYICAGGFEKGRLAHPKNGHNKGTGSLTGILSGMPASKGYIK